MTVLTWKTPNTLGTYSAGQKIELQLKVTGATGITFSILNGTLPSGIVIGPKGFMSGTIPALALQSKYVFTVRATSPDATISDRTFTIVVGASSGVSFVDAGLIIDTTDAVWVDYQVEIINPANQSYAVLLSGGELPDGLYLTESGRICGYAARPINSLTNLATTKTFHFVLTVVAHDTGQTDVQNFQIRIALSGNRKPVILNKTPPVDYASSVFAAYYNTSGFLGSYKANEEMAFKIVGKDFTGQRIQYIFTNLPDGLVGNQDTGWVTGVIAKNSQTYQRFNFQVEVYRYGAPDVSSDSQEFSFILYNKITPKILWKTNSVLPNHITGEQCYLKLNATTPTSAKVVFQKVGGQLPPNTTLTANGELRGRISFQPNKQFVKGYSKTFYFTVKAYSKVYPEISSSRDFALTVSQPFTFPCDRVYFKSLPSLTTKLKFKDFINDLEVFNTNTVFRPTDPEFGVCKDIRMYLSYNIKASTAPQYINSMDSTFHTKKVYMGDIKTAIAKDDDGNVIYEVVYVDLVDSVDNANLTTFVGQHSVSPNSFDNMRFKLENTLGKNTETRLLPRWKTSQQLNSNILGNIPCWVICYCNVGYSESVADMISSRYKNWISSIPFTVDRIFIDKSQSFNWNSSQVNPTWSSYPGGFPVPSPIDINDFSVLFPNSQII